MVSKFTTEQIDDLRQKLELVYGRAFEEAEVREIAERLLNLYEEVRGGPEFSTGLPPG